MWTVRLVGSSGTSRAKSSDQAASATVSVAVAPGRGGPPRSNRIRQGACSTPSMRWN